MRIIARNRLAAFAEKNPQTRASLFHWFAVTKAATWQSTTEIVADFSKAKTVNAERVRFEVSGGDFRLIAAFDFGRQIAFIKFIGTHGEYDKIDAATVSLF